MRRRNFIAGLASATAAWPVAARAQQPVRLRRIGVLMSWDESDPEIKTFLSSFMQGLAELGWTDGGNVRMEVRWAGSNVDRLRMFAKELVDLQPDAILATSTPSTAALQQATRTIPIVIAGISDPVGAGFVGDRGPRRRSGRRTARDDLPTRVHRNKFGRLISVCDGRPFGRVPLCLLAEHSADAGPGSSHTWLAQHHERCRDF